MPQETIADMQSAGFFGVTQPKRWEGGRYRYTAMGGLGFHVIDLADPCNMKTLANLDLRLSVGGVEGDNTAVLRVGNPN